MSKSGDIGTKTAQALVRVLNVGGFPFAERRDENGRFDRGDITGCPGLVWQVKGGNAARDAGPAFVADALEATETQRRNAHADVGILVLARRGYGYPRAGQWWAILHHSAFIGLTHPSIWKGVKGCPVWLTVADLLPLLREAGYGTAPDIT